MAFRNDYCRRCGAERFAALARSLEGATCNSCEAEYRPLKKKDDEVRYYSED